MVLFYDVFASEGYSDWLRVLNDRVVSGSVSVGPCRNVMSTFQSGHHDCRFQAGSRPQARVSESGPLCFERAFVSHIFRRFMKESRPLSYTGRVSYPTSFAPPVLHFVPE
jgi:hypothetical protein